MRAFLMSVIGGLVLLGLAAGSASADPYPTKRITLIVNLVPGGVVDALARLVASKLSDRLGQPVVVENLPGAGGLIGATAAERAAPDGYTFYFGGVTGFHPLLTKNDPIDASKDFEPITDIATGPVAMVVSSQVPANSMAELVAYSKANPDLLNHGEAGTINILLAAVLKDRTGLNYTGIPYNGTADVLIGMLGGQVHFALTSILPFISAVNDGKAKILFATQKMSLYPNVPTAKEAGVDNYDFVLRYGLWAPKGTPQDIRDKLYTEMQAFVKMPDVLEKLKQFGLEPYGSTAEQQLKDFATDMDLVAQGAHLAHYQPQ